MKSTEVKGNDNVFNYQLAKNTYNQLKRSNRITREKSFSEILLAEGCDSLITYIGWLGFINDPNAVILSSMHHYYYDPEELKSVSTIINLKELNQIKQIRNFLHSLKNTLQRSSNFIGYFNDNKKHVSVRSSLFLYDSNEAGFLSANTFLNMIYKLTDTRIHKIMSKKNVRMLLEEYGFKVLDMTELDGITFFHAQVA